MTKWSASAKRAAPNQAHRLVAEPCIIVCVDPDLSSKNNSNLNFMLHEIDLQVVKFDQIPITFSHYSISQTMQPDPPKTTFER